MKKVIAIILTVVLTLSMAACGNAALDSIDRTDPDEILRHTDPTRAEPTEPAETEPTEPAELTARQVAELTQAATVTVSVDCGDYGTSTGSGFFIDDSGTIVTNYHVIDGAVDIEVEVFGGGRYEVATIVDFDELHDIAILRINYSGNPYLEVNENGVVTGETVYANGSSLGVLDGSFSDGIVSAESRKVGVIDCIQVTAPISSGNSGGPLVNKYGEVIGINAFSYSNGQNLNLAIDIKTLNLLPCDKNWTISNYMQWYDKQIARSYLVHDADSDRFYLSKINRYETITNAECLASAYDYAMEHFVWDYDESYPLHIYEYNAKEFDEYCEYLTSIGFEYDGKEEYQEGMSYFYINTFEGYYMDLFESDGLLFVYLYFY